MAGLTLKDYLFDRLEVPGRVLLASRGLGRLGQRSPPRASEPRREAVSLSAQGQSLWKAESDSLVTDVEEVDMKYADSL